MFDNILQLSVGWYDYRTDILWSVVFEWKGTEHNIRTWKDDHILRKMDEPELYEMELFIQAIVGSWLDDYDLWD